MNTEFPVVIPPQENAAAEIIHVKASRENVEFFQRKAVAKVMEQLNPILQDAAMEICLAPMVYENPGKVRMMTYGRVSGMPPAEFSAYILDVKRKYEDWRKRMSSDKPLRITMANGKPMFIVAAKALTVCLRVCQEEHSITSVRLDESISEKTAIRLLQHGLNEYSVIAGWGDQIGA